MSNDYAWGFAKIESARLHKGHSPEEACVALKISRATWNLWKSKKRFQTRQGTDARIREYLGGRP